MDMLRRKCERKKLEPLKTGANRGRKLKAAKQTAWLFVRRLRQETTLQEVIAYLIDKGREREIKYEQVETKGRNEAFEIGFNLQATS